MPPPHASPRATAPVWRWGIALSSLCVCLYVLHPPIVQSASFLLSDSFARMAASAPKSQRVLLVDLDEDSLRLHGQWPWPRWMLADLANALLDAGASVLAFDVLFPESDRSSPLVFQSVLADRFGVRLPLDGIPTESLDFDLFFARAIRGRPVVLACEMVPGAAPAPDPTGDGVLQRIHVVAQDGATPEQALIPASSSILPIPALAQDTHLGFINALPDPDGKIRSTPLLWAWGDRRIYPALPLEIFRIHQGASSIAVRLDRHGVAELRVGRASIPVDTFGRMTLNYRARAPGAAGLASSFPRLPAHSILSGSFDPALVSGRAVIVGTSAAGLKDVKSTPLSQAFSGAEVHATALDNLLAGDVVRTPPGIHGLHALLVGLVGLFLTFLGAGRNSRAPFVGFLLLLVFLPAAGLLALTRLRLVFVPAWEILTAATLYPVLATLRFWHEERRRKWVRSLFGTMVSDRVLRYLESHPDSISLRGTKTEASVLFSDLAGFTAISERMPPEQVSELLNRYFSPMSDIVHARDGYLDKYEGDLVMAVWGVPFASGDHALQACRAALEQQRALAVLAPDFFARFGCSLRMRIGINTGPLIAGNMGSARRFQYTVVGDTVNLASRLEQAGKIYRVPILIGEATRAAAGDAVEVRLLDRLRAAGKTVPVDVYELLGERGGVPPERVQFARLYEEALHAARRRQWAEALRAAERARSLAPDDPPLDLLVRRIRFCSAAPPPEPWDGVFPNPPSISQPTEAHSHA